MNSGYKIQSYQGDDKTMAVEEPERPLDITQSKMVHAQRIEDAEKEYIQEMVSACRAYLSFSVAHKRRFYASFASDVAQLDFSSTSSA